jgi:hypothetical protein
MRVRTSLVRKSALKFGVAHAATQQRFMRRATIDNAMMKV